MVFFIMMSWIAWIHSLVGACDSDEVTVQDYFLVWFVSSWVWRYWFHLVLILWLCECRSRESLCRRSILWCHTWLGTTIEWELLALIYLLNICRCWRFVLDPVATETSLTFLWCTCYLHGVWGWLDLEDSWGSWLFSWCVEMVIHVMWRWFSSWCVEMVASWGLMGFLVMVWFMLSFDSLSLVLGWFHFLCHDILLIHV